MGADWGRYLRLSIFGESHGKGIGMLIDGLPPGIEIDEDLIATDMKRRAPGRDKTATPRKETDQVNILSGLYQGKTTGTPICGLIENNNIRSGDYANVQRVARPGHADYTGFVRFLGANDIRGGGHFSGRLTAPLVFAGSLLRQWLSKSFGIEVAAHVLSIENVEDRKYADDDLNAASFKKLRTLPFPLLDLEKESAMRERVEAARKEQDSVGGTIECAGIHIPAGWGSPFFDSLESNLAHLLFSVPALKGIEFGAGFEMAQWRASKANDPMYFDDKECLYTDSNHNGGINGGISNGMPIVFRVAVKPTPSIAAEQNSIDYCTKANTTISVAGRHDPCIVLRAIPVIEACLLLALGEAALELYGQWGGAKA